MSGGRTTGVLVAAAAALVIGTSRAEGSAQGAPACTAAPAAPRSLSLKVQQATPPRTSGDLPTPALVFLQWRPPDVSLGAEVDSYVLEVGSLQAASDVARIDTESQVPSYVTPVPNGTFFVRVRAVNGCGVSPPSNERNTRIRGSVEPGVPNPAAIVEAAQGQREHLADTAFLQITGQVRNGWGAAPASFVEVRAVFEGRRGDLAQQAVGFVNGTSRRLARSGLVTDTVLEAGAAGCFVLFAELPTSAEVRGLWLNVSARALPVGPVDGRLVARPGAPRVDEFGDLAVSAQVINGGSTPAVMAHLWTQMADAEGRVIGCRGTHSAGATSALDRQGPAGLAPGDVASLEIPTELEAAKVRSLVQWTTWELDPAGAPAATAEFQRLRQALLGLLTQPDASQRAIVAARDAFRRELRRIEDELARAGR